MFPNPKFAFESRWGYKTEDCRALFRFFVPGDSEQFVIPTYEVFRDNRPRAKQGEKA